MTARDAGSYECQVSTVPKISKLFHLKVIIPKVGEVLYCTVLYCTILHCTILVCTVFHLKVIIPKVGEVLISPVLVRPLTAQW